MEFRDNRFFVTDSAADMEAFGVFLGGVHHLSLAEEIKDSHGKVLVQAGRALSLSILKSLKTREGEFKFNYLMELTEELRSAIASLFAREMDLRLSLKRFSLAGFLLKNRDVNLTRYAILAAKNDFFAGFTAMVLYQKRPIVEHLFEVALSSLALVISLRGTSLEMSEGVSALQAGFLHDHAISHLINWEDRDYYRDGDVPEHVVESATALSPHFDADFIRIISATNNLSKSFEPGSKQLPEKPDLAAAVLNLAEYHFHLLRQFKVDPERGEDDDEIRYVLYQLAMKTEKGCFHGALVARFQEYYSRYAEFFRYGAQIAQTEKMCPHGEFALAYPKPRSTQVLCKNASFPCEHRISSQKLHIVKLEDDNLSRFGEYLFPDWYEKCAFSSELPEPPDNF